MANEKHDPWALLREAAEHMKVVAQGRNPCRDYVSCDRGLDMTTRIDAALAEAEKPADEPPIGNCRLCGPKTQEQTLGVYGGSVKLLVCYACFGPIRGADGEPMVEKLRGGDE